MADSVPMIPLRLSLLVCLLLGSGSRTAEPSGPLATGQVAGVIRFTGPVPPVKKIVTPDNSTILHQDLVVDPRSKGLRDVLTVLETAPAQPKLKNAKAVLVDQRD